MYGRYRFLPILLLFAVVAFAQEVGIYSIHADQFLEDADPLRYSPMGLVDNDSSTVFAVSTANTSPDKPIVSMDFSGPTELDGVTLQAGYNDTRYFLKNDRPKKIRIVVRSAKRNRPDQEYPFDLADKMDSQQLHFKETITGSGLDVYVTETYAGSTWRDLVVSDVKCLRGEKSLDFAFRHEPMDQMEGFLWSQEDVSTKYGSDKRPIEETKNYHKMGWETTWYHYNPEGLVVSQFLRKATPDGDEDSQQLLFYREGAKQPFRATTYSPEGKPLAETTFSYANSRLTKEVRTGTDPSVTTFTYKGDLLVKKERRAKDFLDKDYTETSESFYKNGKETGEKISLLVDGKTSVTIYQNVYQDNRIAFKVPIFVSPGTMNFSKRLTYDGGLLTSTVSSLHSVY